MGREAGRPPLRATRRTTRHRAVEDPADRQTVEEAFGYMKTVVGGREFRYIGRQRIRAWFIKTGAIHRIIHTPANLDLADRPPRPSSQPRPSSRSTEPTSNPSPGRGSPPDWP